MRIFLVFLVLICTLNAKSFFSNNEQADNSVYIGALKDLMIATQKTRGLTNSYLNGNTSSMLLIYGTRDDMKDAIGTMESLPLAADTVINTRATAISQALIKLNHKAFKRKAKEVFSDYTEQIDQILMLAQTVNKRFTKDLNPFGQEVSSVMMETMLPMTEYVGQMRGFGSGLAAKGSVNKTELEKIMVLSSQIKRLNGKLQQKMKEIIAKYPQKYTKTAITKDIANIANATKDYTSFAEKEFSSNPKNIDPNAYFENGTKLISYIIQAYNANNKALLQDSKGWF
jgi:hypothetical protein